MMNYQRKITTNQLLLKKLLKLQNQQQLQLQMWQKQAKICWLQMYFGLKEDQISLFVIHQIDGNKFFKSNLKPDHLAAWVKGIQEGGHLLCPKTSSSIYELENDHLKTKMI
ncbi:protein disulfide-isomerase-like [Vicia villosa]|uniref:protein disulfide-isomerase-like n=1 Tax=Vicia villosa TaxID=3911 RepID=UPI00273AF862|nr:protein disulfide-isomerase-like [Vicia villosa]